MRTIRSSAALAAGCALLAGLASISVAQEPSGGAPSAGPPRQAGAPSAGGLGVHGMAVVDVAYIFKNHARFKQQMDLMKQKVQAAEAEVQKEQQEMRKLVEQMKTFNQGSQEYRRTEESVLRKQGDLNLKVSMQKKEFLEQEGKIYFSVSREIDDAVKMLATKHNVALVLRFNGDPVDPNDRNEILRGINKPIVYNDPRMDITPYVLQELNRSAGVSDLRGNSVPVPVNSGPPR